MRRHLSLIVAICVCHSASHAVAANADSDLDALQGTWVVAERVVDGLAMPIDKLPKHEFIVSGNQAKFFVIPTDRKHVARFKIQLDSLHSPNAINLVIQNGAYKDQTLLGIYKLDGDQLVLCVPENDSYARPTEFEAKQGSLRQLIRLVRRKRADEAKSVE